MRKLLSVFLVLTLCTGAAWARGGGGCLEQGTPVLTPDGPKPVEDIKPGDNVLTFRDNRVEQARVAACSEVLPEEYVHISLTAIAQIQQSNLQQNHWGAVALMPIRPMSSDTQNAGNNNSAVNDSVKPGFLLLPGGSLTLTAEHPVAVGAGEFRIASRLRAGDRVLVCNGATMEPGNVSSVCRTAAVRPAYNLLVENAGTYIAGGVLLHNKGCFLPDTPIMLGNGSTKPIGQVCPGDRVMAFHLDGSIARTTVRNVIRHEVDGYMVVTTPKIVLNVTTEHPFYVGNGTFKTIGSLKAGDAIFAFDGNRMSEQKIVDIRRVDARATVYNLQTDEPCTFFAAGIAVHNKGGGCFLPDAPIMLGNGSTKPIGQVCPGDRVMAFQLDGSIARTAVRNVIRHEVDGYMVVTTPKIVLNVTTEHPFYVGNGTFKTIGSLKAGDTIFAFDGNRMSEQKIVDIRRVDARATVYNLQTDEPCTFFAAGIAVHNKGGGCFPRGTLVETPDGRRTIETLAPGDTLLTMSGRNRLIAARVESTFARRSRLLEIRTESGLMRATTGQPFALAEGGFCNAGLLIPGRNLLTLQNGKAVPTRVLSVKTIANVETVFNLSVRRAHTFIANGFLVHNKGGGGFRSSSGSSGGGGDSPAPIFIFIGIVVVMIVISKLKSSKDEEEDLDYSYSRAEIKTKAVKTVKLLDFIAKQDPSFAPEDLRKVARSTFVKLQECWQARNYDPMKTLMMRDLLEEHVKQIQGMVRNHEINMISGLLVREIDLVNVRYTDKPGDREFTALITATARDYYTDDRTGKFVRGDSSPAQFQEFWTFQLAGGNWLLREIEQTRESDVLKDENFFAPFTDQQLEQVYGGAVDQTGPAGPWLDKATGGKATKIERLLNFLYETDKLWNRQAMLNRAREIFTEVYMSWESCNLPDAAAAKLFPDVAEHLRSEQARWKAEGSSVEYRNFCVRKIELILVRNYNDRTRDEYVTRISAHAQTCIRRNGTVTRQDEYVMPFQEYWVFGRLDEQWKLKETLPSAQGEQALTQENVDEGSGADHLKWFYSKKRTV